MPRALSFDLRVRVLTAVAGGLSHRQAGERFGVSAASVSRWRALERERGEARARSQGGDRRSGRFEAHKDTVLALIEATPDTAIIEEAAPGARRQRRERRLWHDPPLLRPPRHHAQKKTAHAAEQDRPDILKRREAWFDGQLDLRSRTFGLHRRDLGFDQNGALPRPLPPWPTPACRRPARPLENDDFRRRPDHPRHVRAFRSRWSNQPQRLRDLCRARPCPRTAQGRHRRHGQPVQP